MPIASITQPVCTTSDQAFAITVNVAIGDAYSNTPLDLASGDCWIDAPGLPLEGVSIGINGSAITATIPASLLSDLIGSSQAVIRWVDVNGSPGQLQFTLEVSAGLAPAQPSGSSTGVTANIYVGAPSSCGFTVIMYPAGPAGPPGTGTAGSVVFSTAAQATLEALSITASTVEAAILALAAMVVSGNQTGTGAGGDSNMSEAGNASQTTML